MDWYDRLVSEKRGIWWKLTLQETGDAIGACGFNGWNHDAKNAEVGFWLLPEHWGQGYMKEALKTTLQYGFNIMRLKLVIAEVEEGNEASAALLRQLGFAEKQEKEYLENKAGAQIRISVSHLAHPGF